VTARIFAEARDTARKGGEFRHEGCGFASFAADLTAHRRNLNACGDDLAGIRARLARIAEAEGWNFNEQED
jgi:hypothetical protein